jgi:GNAT superfamily N-acetyltransferase
MNYLTVPLTTRHNRTDFNSGASLLDRYFQQQANQDVKRKLSACFVYEHEDKKTIVGYYTLSSSSIPQALIPHGFSKQLPKSYSSIRTILLGRIAIDQNFQGKGIGRVLLIDALKRCYETSATLGAFAVIVDPIDRSAIEFYNRLGFIKLPDSTKMFLPMRTIKDLFE